MELARALTSRKRQGSDLSNKSHPSRAASMKASGGGIKRSAISSPLELISTTNVLAYNAPNIYGSSDESDNSLTFSGSSRATTPETDHAPSPVEPNHLSAYFNSARSNSTRRSKDSTDSDGPLVPTRALSHTKKSHQASVRKRSQSKTTPPPNTIHNPTSFRGSADMFTGRPESNHPFGAELAKVNEVAEGYSAREVLVLDEEEQYLMSHGLCKFGAEDYLDEIQGFGGSYNNPFSPFNQVWI